MRSSSSPSGRDVVVQASVEISVFKVDWQILLADLALLWSELQSLRGPAFASSSLGESRGSIRIGSWWDDGIIERRQCWTMVCDEVFFLWLEIDS